jgi:putative ABC transport system permease protein
MKYLFLIFKNITRNPLRSLFTALGTMVLVAVVTLVWSMLDFLDAQTAARSTNIKVIVTERWQTPSQMPFTYARSLCEGAARRPGDACPLDWMTWQFYIGSIDPAKMTRESMIFIMATQAEKLCTMLDEIDEMPREKLMDFCQAVERLKTTHNGLILGKGQLAAMGKRVGDRITVYSKIYYGIDLEFEIVGLFPSGRYDNSAAMNCTYLNDAINAFALRPPGRPHYMADHSMNVVWLRVKDRDDFRRIAAQIMSSPEYRTPAVKCEMASSGAAAFLESFRDLIWGMRWLLVPACLVTISLVITIAISINVRERRAEMAVLKVLGFRPVHILSLVIGESLLLGVIFGLLGTGATYAIINVILGGLKFPMNFFSSFYIPLAALWWGPAVGALTALAGSFLPAWTARSVRVAEVFSRVA